MREPAFGYQEAVVGPVPPVWLSTGTDLYGAIRARHGIRKSASTLAKGRGEATLKTAAQTRFARTVSPVANPSLGLRDFVYDACAEGQQIKCQTIIAEWTKECLAINVACHIRSNRVIKVLSRLVSQLGASHRLRSDNGLELSPRR